MTYLKTALGKDADKNIATTEFGAKTIYGENPLALLDFDVNTGEKENSLQIPTYSSKSYFSFRLHIFYSMDCAYVC